MKDGTKIHTMLIDTEKTLVTFYKEADGDIMAYFPLEDYDMAGNKTSYAHIGQHSACHPDYVKDLKVATSKEYAPLHEELTEIGYNLKVV